MSSFNLFLPIKSNIKNLSTVDISKSETNLVKTNEIDTKNPIERLKLLTVCIMVKNEEKRIHVTLESIKNITDNLVILDTGSTDNTLNIIKTFCNTNDIPLHLIQKRFDIDSDGNQIPFDFRVSRNYMLKFSDEHAYIWELLLDSNDEVKNPQELREFLMKAVDGQIGFIITQEWNYGNKIDKFFNIRIIKSRSGFLYGATNPHEALINPKHDLSKSLMDSSNRKVVDFSPITIYQDRTQDNDKSKLRFKNDKIQFKKTIEELSPKYEILRDLNKESNLNVNINLENIDLAKLINPEINEKKQIKDFSNKNFVINENEYAVYTRALFYMGQTCLSDGEPQEAMKYYQMRSRHTLIFSDEVYFSLYQCGVISKILNHDIEETIMWALKAFQVHPRAEALNLVTLCYYGKFTTNCIGNILHTTKEGYNNLLLSQMYASYVCKLDYPVNDVLFIDWKMYNYTRWALLARINMFILMFKKDKALFYEGLDAIKKAELYSSTDSFGTDINKEDKKLLKEYENHLSQFN